MGFLTPWFFAGLAAIGVPIAIHLINRERKTVVHFPSLMFLQRIPYKSVRRQKLRHLLLFALRCLALIFLAAAFTRPFFARRTAADGSGIGARERVVLLDRSYSMAYGSRWTEATAAARKALNELGPSDKATLVLFDNEATAVTEPTSRRDQFERALSLAKPGDEGTHYATAIKLASQILEGSNLPRKDVVLISDFQKAGWQHSDEVRVPLHTAVTTIDVSHGAAPDAAVTQVMTSRDTATAAGARAQVTVAARVSNTAKVALTLNAVLELGGRDIETKRVTIPASGSAQVRFSPTAVPTNATKGAVRIPRDSLDANNTFRFTIAPDEAVSVLVIEPDVARASQSLFVSKALAIGDRPTFKVDVKKIGALTAADFASRSLVVLNEVPPPAGALGQRLRAMIDAGTGLLFAPGDVPAARIAPEWLPLMPGRLAAVADRTHDAGATLASLQYSHPMFELFAAAHSGDFSTAHMFRYRTITVPGDSGVIARFDDGAPAAVERAVGHGKIVIWATSLDEYWTDLPLQPVFLPFIHETAKYAARYSDSRTFFTAGEALDLSRHGELTSTFQGNGTAAGELVLESPSGKKTRLDVGAGSHLADLTESGFYELRGPGTAVGSGRPIAVNVDVAESDLAHIDPAEIVSAITAPPVSAASAAGAGVGTPDAEERRQAIWWYLLGAALLCVAGEVVLANRLSRAAS